MRQDALSQASGAKGRITLVRSSDGSELQGRSLGGKLVLEERVGAGALGVVYRAKHSHLPRPLAVKVLHSHCQANPGFRARFHAEARAASVLDHPNLVRVVDFGEEWDGLVWLAMELLDGKTLEHVLATEGVLSLERATDLVLQICAGLAHAHAGGVFHGDVKPSNVVLVRRAGDDGEDSERAKLCDFGIARVATGGDPDQSGEYPVVGTPAYMAPEQCLGEPLDARSDVYAAGVVLYELLTGTTPFVGEPQVMLRQHLLVEPPSVSARRPELGPRVDALLGKALAKERDHRFQSMREMRAALRELLASEGVSVPPSITPPPARSTIRSNPPPPANPPATGSGPRAIPDDNRAWPRLTPRPSRLTGVHEKAAPSSKDPALPFARALAAGSIDDIARLGAQLCSRRADAASYEALTLLDEPERLAPLAERMLAEDVLPTPYLERVVERAGSALGQALWAARIGAPPTPARRARFVTWLAAVGPENEKVLQAALLKLAPHADAGTHAQLLEDVLLAVPVDCEGPLLEAVARLSDCALPRVRELVDAKLLRRARDIA